MFNIVIKFQIIVGETAHLENGKKPRTHNTQKQTIQTYKETKQLSMPCLVPSSRLRNKVDSRTNIYFGKTYTYIKSTTNKDLHKTSKQEDKHTMLK